MKIAAILCCCVLLGTGRAFAADPPRHDAISAARGAVPDAVTAIKIAVAVWEPIYGAKNIAAEKPYRAELVKGIWIVQGSMPTTQVGGVAVAEISKADGRILRVSHGK